MGKIHDWDTHPVYLIVYFSNVNLKERDWDTQARYISSVPNGVFSLFQDFKYIFTTYFLIFFNIIYISKITLFLMNLISLIAR